MNVVPATYEHVTALRLLYRRLVDEQAATFAPPYPVIDAEELDRFTIGVAGRLGQDDTFLAFIAITPEGRPVGFLAGSIDQRAIGKPHVFAAPYWMYVLPDYRGQGIARQLVVVGIAAMEARGIHDVELTALAGDPQWKNRGWEPFTTRYHLPTSAIASILAARAEAPPSPTPPVPEPEPVTAAAPAPPRRRRARKRRRRLNGHAPLDVPSEA